MWKKLVQAPNNPMRKYANDHRADEDICIIVLVIQWPLPAQSYTDHSREEEGGPSKKYFLYSIWITSILKLTSKSK